MRGIEPAMDSNIIKSQSTIQLMGFLSHTPSSILPSSTSSTLIGYGDNTSNTMSVLFELSTNLLSSVQLLRRIIGKYTYGKIGRELHYLSLTTGAFERALFSFIQLEILPEKVNLTTQSAMKDALPHLKEIQHHSVLSGGMGSLLRHASGAFADTISVLQTLDNSYDPFFRQFDWRAWKSMVLVVACYLSVKKFQGSTMRINSLFSKKGLKGVLMCMAIMDVLGRIRYRFSSLRKIKICHCQVLLTLRLFLLCQHIVERGRIRKSSSMRLLIDDPCTADYDDNEKNATNLLVERVPVPADYYNRSTSADFGLSIYKNICTVCCAAAAAAYQLVGERAYSTLAVPATLCFVPYFALFPTQASRFSTRILIDAPNIEIMRTAWGLLGESKLSMW